MQVSHLKIYITGTPGTGKTTIGHLLKSRVAFKDVQLFELNELMGLLNLFEGVDPDRSVSVYDPWEVVNPLEKYLKDYKQFLLLGAPLPFTSVTWDCIIVLTCSKGNMLRKRLKDRGYNQSKVEENVEAELIGEILGNVMDWLGAYGGILTLDTCNYSMEEIEQQLMTYLIDNAILSI